MASSYALSPQLPGSEVRYRTAEENCLGAIKKPVVWLVMVQAFLLSAAVWLNLVMGAHVNVDETLEILSSGTRRQGAFIFQHDKERV